MTNTYQSGTTRLFQKTCEICNLFQDYSLFHFLFLMQSMIMRVTTKGQVTIPRAVREVLGIKAETEIGFIEENRRFYISKSEPPKQSVQFNKLRGVATVNIPTNVIMALTREVESAR